ncbi:MAG: hypothetical protein PVF49_13165 [Anaerolineales bacterium]|jgi:hypothetical protein
MISLRKSPFLLLSIFIFIVSGCSTNSPTASTSPDEVEPEPTHPEAGAPGTGPDSIQPPGAPTVAPEFTYSGHGETLALFLYVEEGSHRIVFIDPYGLGTREIRLPEGIEPPRNLSDGLSPDGAYYAYYHGSTYNTNLTLGIYDLNTETLAMEIPLLSSDYPNNFQELADSFIQSGNIPQDLAYVEPENLADELQFAFEYAFPNIRWSPGGRNLAFSGQMEGPSSDLYVLDIQTQEISRLTSGTGMMMSIGWSPDGHWIRHTSTYFVGAGYDVTNHVASRDGSQVISFPHEVGLGWGPWLNTNQFLANEAANGPGTFGLKVMDARYGSYTTIYEGAFGTYALDPVSETILLHGLPDFYGDQEEGLYRVEASEPYSVTQIRNPGAFHVDYLGLDAFPFIGFPGDGGTVLIRLDGSFEPLSDQVLRWSTAPSANLVAFFPGYGENGLWIFDADQNQRTDVYQGAVRWAYWRSDSGALFYLTDHEFHFYDLETGDHMLIYAWPGSPVLDTYTGWVTLP